MAITRVKRTPPEPSTTRTNRDWVMIVLGAALVLLFLIAGYVSLSPTQAPGVPKIRGPVKDPKKMGFLKLYDRNQMGNPTSRTELAVDVANREKLAV